MPRAWTFGQKIFGGFAAITALTVFVAAGAMYTIARVVEAEQAVIAGPARDLALGESLAAALEHKVAASRGYFLSGDAASLAEVDAQRREIRRILSVLRAHVDDAEGLRLLDRLERLEQEHHAASQRVYAMRQGGASLEDIVRTFEAQVRPLREQVGEAQDDVRRFQERQLREGERAAAERATIAQWSLGLTAFLALFVAIVVAVVLSRGVTRQLGSAIQQMQSSSAELQAAAAQQAAGAKEQTSATAEVTTTLKELAATSRQMSESAQRVARLAEDANGAARAGGVTVQRAQEAIHGIKNQVDLIVGHMLDLGRKAQQVGAILEIINELAEQTNILAINATIESAGAGEGGRRFAVVADEIRKLADRVGGSTKEIRTLVEEIRAAANTTVMATEDGSKAVDAGTRQFADVGGAFRQIAAQVETATEAAREIELGTKQQVTAVEQVNVAVVSVAQAVTEGEASTRQTLETATQLTKLSRGLSQLVQRTNGAPRVEAG